MPAVAGVADDRSHTHQQTGQTPKQTRQPKEQTLQEDFWSYLPRNNSARVFRRREAQYCFQSRVNKVCDAAAAERGPRRAPQDPGLGPRRASGAE